MTNIHPIKGKFQREGKRLTQDCTLIKVVTRKNPKPRQPTNYLTCYPDICADSKVNYYLSGLYPTQDPQVFRIEYNRKYYHVTFTQTEVTFEPIQGR
jgi:hypothetical protein